ncbi:3-isopropylmalate dehydrogenase [Chloroflexota bacterium]
MQFNLAVLPGDGVGPEVTTEGIKMLQTIGKRSGHTFNLKYGLVGGVAIDETDTALPDDTLKMCQRCDAVLLGAVGGPKWDDPKSKVHPEDGLLALRKGLGLFANLRPVKVYPPLVDNTNLKPKVIDGVDFIFVRELTGGVYFARPKRQWQTSRGRRATDSMTYSEQEIERIVRVGFELARTRHKKLTSVDKANVLQSSRLWRQVAIEVAAGYPDVEMDHMLVDACAMRLIQNPAYFDVLVTENMFGDILTDEASMLAGSMGMLPSASLSEVPQAGGNIFGMYEPIHGSAPRRAGLNMANPTAIILSIAMMLRYSCSLVQEAETIEAAVDEVLQKGYRTYDIMDEGKTKVGTKEMGDLIAKQVGG